MAFFPSLKHNFIAYHSSSRPDSIFEIHQLWQSGFSRVYSNCCLSCLFEAEIRKIGQSSHKIYSNNILNFQESTAIFNAYTKKFGNLLNALHLWVRKYRLWPFQLINVWSLNQIFRRWLLESLTAWTCSFVYLRSPAPSNIKENSIGVKICLFKIFHHMSEKERKGDR